MTQEIERLEILEMIQRGTISPEEGLKLIESLGETWENLDQEYADAKAKLEGEPDLELIDEVDSLSGLENYKEWRKWWIIPFWIGVGIIDHFLIVEIVRCDAGISFVFVILDFFLQ